VLTKQQDTVSVEHQEVGANGQCGVLRMALAMGRKGFEGRNSWRWQCSIAFDRRFTSTPAFPTHARLDQSFSCNQVLTAHPHSLQAGP
jgi:hypothetical protein